MPNKTKRVIALRTRNLGTMTEAEYFAKLRSSLRSCFRFWKPILKVLKDAERPSQSTNKRLKHEYQCNKCKGWFPRKQVQVDHIIPCGELRCYEDIVPFIQNLSVEDLAGYQVLCSICHLGKTKQEKKDRKDKLNTNDIPSELRGTETIQVKSRHQSKSVKTPIKRAKSIPKGGSDRGGGKLREG